MLNKVKAMKQYQLNCIDGEIGKVKDFYFDDQTWKIKYLVVNTGNWLIGRQVLISPFSITSANKEEAYITINLTKKQIENSPVLENDKPVSLQFEREYYGYFEYPFYDPVMGARGIGNILPYSQSILESEIITKDKTTENEWDPNLRSMLAVSGYGVESIDKKIGHVEDFIIDIETWEIRYIEVDTLDWLPHRRILIAPKWLSHISWADLKVFVNLNAEEIKKSPEYTVESILDRDFELLLHKHYNRLVYWLNS